MGRDVTRYRCAVHVDGVLLLLSILLLIIIMCTLYPVPTIRSVPCLCCRSLFRFSSHHRFAQTRKRKHTQEKIGN